MVVMTILISHVIQAYIWFILNWRVTFLARTVDISRNCLIKYVHVWHTCWLLYIMYLLRLLWNEINYKLCPVLFPYTNLLACWNQHLFSCRPYILYEFCYNLHKHSTPVEMYNYTPNAILCQLYRENILKYDFKCLDHNIAI